MFLNRKLFPIAIFGPVLCQASCGADYHYEEASKLQRQGLLLKAAAYYKIFADRNPGDKRAPDAIFKAADIYSRNLSLCSRSKPLFERLLKNYPGTPLRDAAMRGLFICPDYFPIDRRLSWTYGDSETGGANARQETRVLEMKPAGTVTRTTIYAGADVVSRQTRTYRLADNDLMETQGGFDTIIMRYPLEKDRAWASVSAGRKVAFAVRETGLRVKVRAGEFENCVKIRQHIEGLPSWIYEYYAPWTGKILTSVAGKGYENRVTELLKYEEIRKK